MAEIISEEGITDFEIINCKFKCSLPKMYDWINSNHSKLTKDFVTGHVYIACLLKYSKILEKLMVDVKVMKTYFRPAMVTIKLQISEMNSHVRNVNYWGQECTFLDLYFKHGDQVCSRNSDNFICINNHSRDRHEFVLEVKCQIIWYGFVDDFLSPNSQKIFTHYSENMKYCDMKIKVGDKYYPAHKIIVTSQSPVLEKTLEVNMKESLENCIDLTDLGNDVVEEMLLFLYENKIDKAKNDEDLLLKLLKVGGMYDIPGLRNCCGMLLSNKLTEDNVLMLLEDGHIHNSSILRTRAITYIVIDKDKILTEENFKKLNLRYPELCFEICSTMKFLLSP